MALNYFSDPLIQSILLSISPVSELRGGLPFALASGISFPTAFAVCLAANILIILPIWFFLDFLHFELMKIKIYRKSAEIVLEKMRKRAHKIEKNMRIYGWIALTLAVGIPLPFTGAYTGSIVAWLLELERKKSFLFIALGVVMAAAIVSFIVEGIILFF